MGLPQAAELRESLSAVLPSWFSLPSLLPCEMQFGKVLGACSDGCELPWGWFQVWSCVYLCVFECVFECVFVNPGQGHPQRGGIKALARANLQGSKSRDAKESIHNHTGELKACGSLPAISWQLPAEFTVCSKEL